MRQHCVSKFLLVIAVLVAGVLVTTAHAQTCSIAAWSSATGSVQPIGSGTSPKGKKYEGECALTVDAAAAPGYVTTSAPSDEALFTARFYFYLDQFDLSSGEAIIFTARDGGDEQVQFAVREVSGAPHLVAAYRSGGGLVEHGTTTPLQGTWNAVTATWSAGSGDGTFSARLNGALVVSESGLDNGSEKVNEVDLGLINDPAASGDMVFDAFEMRRTADEPPLLEVNELFNISTRAEVLNLNNIVIAGFVIVGDTPKCVIVRGRGQSLPPFANGDPRLEDPQLTLKSGATTIGFNDNWQDDAESAQIIQDLGRAPGAVSDSAIYTCLEPGAYTALLRGSAGTGRGIGIVEVIDADLGTPYLANISTRAKVGNVNRVVIAGFIINGTESRTVLIKGRGPSLVDADPNLAGATLPDPRLVLKSGSTTLVENDDWAQATNQADIVATGKAPGYEKESAILTTLPPGPYTVLMFAVGGELGIGIIEVLDTEGGSIEPN